VKIVESADRAGLQIRVAVEYLASSSIREGFMAFFIQIQIED
jgi:hypothetical protein